MSQIAPWDIRTDDGRKEDKLITFIIFCEDDVSEPLYFRSFSNNSVKINEIPNQRSKKLNLDIAVEKCTNDGLMVFDSANGKHRIADGVTENIWCVYDRDLENEDIAQIEARNNYSFDNAISGATNSGLRVAWSNDCFELWILLHFEDVDPTNAVHRNYIYSQLTEVYRNLTEKSPMLESITTNPRFNYKSSFKKKQEFFAHVLPFLKDKERRREAIRRAEKIEAYFSTKGEAFHLRNPCTMVHKLVISILAGSSDLCDPQSV